MTERYDIIVIGGGPAGLSAAKAAAAEGGKVLLLEMQSQIGGQTRSATWARANTVDQALEEAVVNEVHALKLHSPHQQLAISGDFGVILDRRIFDKLLAAEAAASGAEIWLSCPVKELLVSNGAVRGVYAEAGAWAERVECGMVIDASGAQGQWSSLLLRKVFKRDWDREQLALSSEYLMTNASARDVELFFTSYFAPLGHVWIYSFGRRFAIAGIRGIRIQSDAALDEFIGRRVTPSLEQAVPVAAFRGQQPIGGALIPTCANGILAAGGAAGQVYALSGEGLQYALACGELAGKIAVEAVVEGDTSGQALSGYDRAWRGKFEGELKVGQLLHAAFRTSFDQKMDRLFNALAGDVELQQAFANAFRGIDLTRALKLFLTSDEILGIFGRETIEKAIAACRL
ncbi:MAG: NAD(P)/FAD-dependent oxidoreductase [Candidatus Hodarchaeaceae archaeon]|nr:NAD(P)/FAD-dependent oxidoreductase [Candidatus Hodarchaeaceae archaeon]